MRLINIIDWKKLLVDCESEISFLEYIQEQCQVGGNVIGIYDTCEQRIKELKNK